MYGSFITQVRLECYVYMVSCRFGGYAKTRTECSMVDRVKVKRTIEFEYDVIPVYDATFEQIKNDERNISLTDVLGMLRFANHEKFRSHVDFEEVYDIPE